MKPDRANLTKEQIADFCQKNYIKKFAYFGSVLRDDFRPDSDIEDKNGKCQSRKDRPFSWG